MPSQSRRHRWQSCWNQAVILPWGTEEQTEPGSPSHVKIRANPVTFTARDGWLQLLSRSRLARGTYQVDIAQLSAIYCKQSWHILPTQSEGEMAAPVVVKRTGRGTY